MKTESAGLSREERWRKFYEDEYESDCPTIEHIMKVCYKAGWNACGDRLAEAEAKLRTHGIIWERGTGYVFDGKS